MHEVDRRRGRDLRRRRHAPRRRRCRRRPQRVDRSGPDAVEEHGPGHPLVGVGVVDGHEALVAEPARRCPTSRGCVRRAPGRRPRRCRRRRARSTPGPRRPRRRRTPRHVVDDPDLPVHGVMIRRWSGTRCRSTRSAPTSGATPDRPRSLDRGPRPGRRRPRPARSLPTSGADRAATSRIWPRPVVALDAADAMLRLARDAAPDAWPVRADLEALPFRRGASRRRVGAGELPARPHRAAAGGAHGPPPRARRRCAGDLTFIAGREAGPSPTTTSPGACSQGGAPTSSATCSSAPGCDVGGRGERHGATWLHVHVGPRPHAARLRRPRDAAARVRAQPVGAQLARYGLMVGDLQKHGPRWRWGAEAGDDHGGRARALCSVTIRYPRDYRSDPQAIATEVLIPIPGWRHGAARPSRQVEAWRKGRRAFAPRTPSLRHTSMSICATAISAATSPRAEEVAAQVNSRPATTSNGAANSNICNARRPGCKSSCRSRC